LNKAHWDSLLIEQSGKVLDYRKRVVGAHVVDDYDFQGRVVLLPDAPKGALE
jgi:hypothetical protein